MPRDNLEPRSAGPIRRDLQLIADMVAPGSRLLDVGCGEGDLLDHLWRTKDVDGRGIEIRQDKVRSSVSRGLSVIQGDANTDLVDYPSASFDYVVLSQTLQAVHEPRWVLGHLVRIGRHAIVSLPNFGYWRLRLALLLQGRMPMTPVLPAPWYETQNIHLCTITDFIELCRDIAVEVEDSLMLRPRDRVVRMAPGRAANLLAEQAVFLLRAARPA